MFRHRVDQGFGRYGITGVQHDAVTDGAEHCDVLESHLRRPVLANRDAAVRTDKLDIGVAIRQHADLVKAAAKECGKGGNKWQLASRR